MDLEKILTDLKRERDRLIHAIALLSGDSAVPGKTGKRAMKGKRRGGITPAGRRRLSLAMKRRWAERRKKAS
ncbi:MAG: hypothetical protein WCA22_21615 [Candidatus Binatus sp.]